MPKLALATTETDTDTATPPDTRPRQVIALGKQTRGKTLYLKWLIERCQRRERTRPLHLLDADPHNPTLSRHFSGVLTPESQSLEDRRIWLEERIRDQYDRARENKPYNAVIDIGGGDHLVAKLAHDIRLTETLERAGIDLITFYLLGPNTTDLEYFQSLHDAGFSPKKLGLIFNGGLVTAGRDPVRAFDPVMATPLVRDLTAQGAAMFFMPALASNCIEAVERLNVRTFREAIPKLDFINEIHLATWLDDSMEAQIGRLLDEMDWTA